MVEPKKSFWSKFKPSEGWHGYAFLAIIISGGVLFVYISAHYGTQYKFFENLISQRSTFKKNDAFTQLNTSNEELLEQAFWQIEQLGKYAVPQLVRIIADDNTAYIERINAIYAMGRLGAEGQKGVNVLLPYLRDKDFQVRGVTVRSLGKIADRGSEHNIEPLLDDESRWVVEGAEIALKKINSSLAKAMLKEHYAVHNK